MIEGARGGDGHLHERSFAVRSATAADAATLARHRVGMMVSIGSVAADAEDARRIESASVQYIATAMERGEWFAWIAEERGVALGSGSGVLRPLPPVPCCVDGGVEAFLLSFFTEPSARRRGVATAVMTAALGWARSRGVARASLFASAQGRPVYEPLGFVARTDAAMEWLPVPAANRCTLPR